MLLTIWGYSSRALVSCINTLWHCGKTCKPKEISLMIPRLLLKQEKTHGSHLTSQTITTTNPPSHTWLNVWFPVTVQQCKENKKSCSLIRGGWSACHGDWGKKLEDEKGVLVWGGVLVMMTPWLAFSLHASQGRECPKPGRTAEKAQHTHKTSLSLAQAP